MERVVLAPRFLEVPCCASCGCRHAHTCGWRCRLPLDPDPQAVPLTGSVWAALAGRPGASAATGAGGSQAAP